MKPTPSVHSAAPELEVANHRPWGVCERSRSWVRTPGGGGSSPPAHASSVENTGVQEAAITLGSRPPSLTPRGPHVWKVASGSAAWVSRAFEASRGAAGQASVSHDAFLSKTAREAKTSVLSTTSTAPSCSGRGTGPRHTPQHSQQGARRPCVGCTGARSKVDRRAAHIGLRKRRLRREHFALSGPFRARGSKVPSPRPRPVRRPQTKGDTAHATRLGAQAEKDSEVRNTRGRTLSRSARGPPSNQGAQPDRCPRLVSQKGRKRSQRLRPRAQGADSTNVRTRKTPKKTAGPLSLGTPRYF